ncbi:hypothetical protein GP486_004158 [Trichoglossum hirsutum]|uniref:Clr5 domain-containing protein n=1 Tax=Trichoglossum hirsutum TaxID=265104 RepID=A0A9P8LBW2_9PEZI|nr:hypothetical protein GP486_004158 [Trichoglossum hirsutum]
MDSSPGPSNIATAAHAHVPYEQKWIVLKPIIKQPYIDEGRTLTHVAELMKEEHGFEANEEQYKITSTWLYRFWLYAFKSAKHWGKGPREWDAESLGFTSSGPMTPEFLSNAPSPESAIGQSAQSFLESQVHSANGIAEPTSLCRPLIHGSFYPPRSEPTSPSTSPSPDIQATDLFDEATWEKWSTSLVEQPFEKVLLNGLASNSFSNIQTSSLPIALPKVAKGFEESGGAFTEEAICFGVMAANSKLVEEMTKKRIGSKMTSKSPLHLAMSYLNAKKSCCLTVQTLLMNNQARAWDENLLGYTPFESLMTSVIRSHTSTAPGIVDVRLRDEKKFPGDEADICGRWSADDSNVREILSSNTPWIPFSWKHKFCHSSVQTVCHCLQQLAGRLPDKNPLLNGLFVKACSTCGMRMRLRPLHTLVLTAWNLANNGTHDEDLFGIIAVLLCMLKNGADPCQTAPVSFSTLSSRLGDSEIPSECDHKELKPSEFAESLPYHANPSRPLHDTRSSCISWSEKITMGWLIFLAILQQSEKEWQSTEFPISGPCLGSLHHRSYFGRDSRLGILWVAVQLEFLVHRRLNESDPWLSPRVDMRKLQEDFVQEDFSYIDSLKRYMKPVCSCGVVFSESLNYPRADEIAYGAYRVLTRSF